MISSADSLSHSAIDTHEESSFGELESPPVERTVLISLPFLVVSLEINLMKDINQNWLKAAEREGLELVLISFDNRSIILDPYWAHIVGGLCASRWQNSSPVV